MDKNQLLAALREKLDAGYEAYMKDMVSRGAEVTFDNAEEIHYNQQIYDAVSGGDLFTTEQLEVLLQLEDPMQVLRDQWAFWSETVLQDEIDLATEMADAVQGYINQMDDQTPPTHQQQGQQM